ncbi:phosphonate C-P lyase system protein PhnH [Streptomyces sp. TS71-3]|uniref:phosphonate C-P lyase system protein PhnH n=1 Tax=Streptomyces sp. TS71-3 TaxID=2733862 RepID=UPI001B0E7E95|nr:phosphonate C-P lyase system protein PhnH [Streptomyces sp. TS71-3]GHJ36989.1 carbon-phosphorus lyase subunit PhnH [Streptomyces sp. TS71-3]
MTGIRTERAPAGAAAATDPAAELVAAARLHPTQAQRTFRAVLDALARPGTPGRLPGDAPGSVPAVLLPVLALADLGTGICVADAAGDPENWSAVAGVATSAPVAPLEEAALVTALRTITPDQVRRLRRGDARRPEDGALLCVPISDVQGGGRTWRLSGPGVPGELAVAPQGVPDGLLAARAEAVAAFPAGIDLLLTTPGGRVIGLPRSTAIVEEDG